MSIPEQLKKLIAKVTSSKVLRIFIDSNDPTIINHRVKQIIIAYSSYRIIEYLFVLITVLLVSLLKYYSFKESSIFLILWAWTIIDTLPFVFLTDWSGVDFTTMGGRRRWLKALYEKPNPLFRILVAAFEFFYCIRLIVWDGPEWFFLFFRERLKSGWSKIATYLATTGIQMAVWTKIYCLGYDSVTDFIKDYWK